MLSPRRMDEPLGLYLPHDCRLLSAYIKLVRRGLHNASRRGLMALVFADLRGCTKCGRTDKLEGAGAGAVGRKTEKEN